MAWKLLVIAVMVASVTLEQSPLHSNSKHGSLITKNTPSRQYVGVKSQKSENIPSYSVTLPDQILNLSSSPTFDIDMPYQTIKFDSSHVDELLSSGTTQVNLPGQTPIELTLISTSNRHGMQSITALHAGLVSTITQRGQNLFMTLATPNESYRIESHNGVGRLFAHRRLAQRSIRHHKDYRYVQ